MACHIGHLCPKRKAQRTFVFVHGGRFAATRGRRRMRFRISLLRMAYDPPQRITGEGEGGDGRESVKYDHVRLDIERYEGTLHGASMISKHLFVADDGNREPEEPQIPPVWPLRIYDHR
jgi:hypothetical protein